MRKTLSLVIALIGTICHANSQTVNIEGNITGLSDTDVVFYYYSTDGEKTDTIKINGGKFTWSGTVNGPQKAMIFLPGASIPFYIEPGVMRIDGKADRLDSLKITGSKTHDEAKRFAGEFRQLSEQKKQLHEKMAAATGDELRELMGKEVLLKKETFEKELRYIKEHPESVISSSLVSSKAALDGYNDGIIAFNALSESFRNSARGKEIAKRLEILKRSRLGGTIPDFEQNDPDGKSVRFADFKGKYIFIDFWASWCAPCREENPNVLSAYNKFKNKNFTVIGVSLDSDRDKWKQAIKEDNMPWAMVSDLKGMNNEISSYFGINGVPSTLLIDPAGKIIAKDLRGEALHQKLAELLLSK